MKKLSRPARKILKSPPGPDVITKMTNLRLVAQLTHHATLLGDSQLDALPRAGVVLFDLEDLLAHRIEFNSLSILVRGLDDADIMRSAAGPMRHVAPGLFNGLVEWSLIERHSRNQPIKPWEELSRQDRIACISSMLSGLEPLDMLLWSTIGNRPANPH